MSKRKFVFVLFPVLMIMSAMGISAIAAQDKVTITVWDYYGEATPIKPLIEPFQQANPDITIQYESLDWATTQERLNVVLAGGEKPDVVTVDMTWLPTLASVGALTDLKPLSNEQLNGVALKDAYQPGALQAMTYGDQILTMMYDFDVYAMYYRADLFEAKGLSVPTNWKEFEDVASKLIDGDQNHYAFLSDPFHTAQWIYENGGSILNEDNTAAVFNSPEAVEAVKFYAGLIKNNIAIHWTTEEGELIQGIKDGRIAMFSDGPYFMGIMKSAAPEMTGKWRVAPHPISKQAGSYLGGTGLVIPAGAPHTDAAWKFIQYALKVENEIGVYKNAGAAPALTAALQSDEINAADPYFGDQKVFSVFLDALGTARPFPYVRQWNDISKAFTTAMDEIALGAKDEQTALDDGVSAVNKILSQ